MRFTRPNIFSRAFLSRLLPISFLVVFFSILFRDVIFNGKIPISTDILFGAYYPWLDYKWGYSVGVPVKNALLSDPFSHFFIFKHLVAALVKSGVWPLWNRFILAGTPLMANYHTNPFFLANFLLLLPKYLGWQLFICLSPFFAAITMYWYLSLHLTSKIARLTGAVIYALSGLMTTWLEIGTAIWAMSMIPLLLLSLDQIIVDHKNKYLILFSFSLAMLIFAGNVQIDTYAFILISLYLVKLFIFDHHRSIHYLYIFIFGILSLGVTLIQLLPSFALFQQSIRGAENFVGNFNYGLIPVSQLIRLWAADFYGNPSTHNHWGPLEYHEYSAFLGSITLPLVLALFFKKQTSSFTKFFLSVFVFSLFLVTLNPISRLIFSLPIPLLTFSLASRLLFLTSLSAAVLVAIYLETFIPKKSIKTPIFISTLLVIITIIGIYLAPVEFRQIALKNSVLPLFFLFCLCVLLLSKLKSKITIILILLITCFDLGRYLTKYNPLVKLDLVYSTTPALEYVQNQTGIFRIAREKTNLMPPNSWAYYGLESVEGYEPLRPLNYSRFFHLLENKSYFNRPFRFSELEDVDPKFLSALNVKYFFISNQKVPTQIQQKLFKAGFKTVFTDKSVSVLENTRVTPRAFYVSSVVKVNSEKDLAEKLGSPDFNPSKTTLVFEDLTQNSFQPDRAPEISHYSDNQIIVKTNNLTPQFLILSNTYDSGWKLKIDNQKNTIYSADGALQGVFVPAGIHTLTFTYLPDSFILGAKLSLSSLLVLIIASILLRYSYVKTKN